LLPLGQQWRMIVLFAAERKLNWSHAKLRQKTCREGSIMLPFPVMSKIVYWQSIRATR
jgi:CRISPR/Cas system-associated protein endoribonuclease Cas2